MKYLTLFIFTKFETCEKLVPLKFLIFDNAHLNVKKKLMCVCVSLSTIIHDE